MGTLCTVVASKISDHPSKCLEVRIDSRRGTPERFFLIPVTLLTMPTPQSPLCVMLNEALSAPVHWAWPPVSNLETTCSGVADDGLALTEASRTVPRVEQTFAHALPRYGTNPRNTVERQAAAVELGHLLSFVAVECPMDCPNGGRHYQRGQRAPQGQEENASIFFDFSAEWLESIAQTEGCTVVGYFRYLNLFDNNVRSPRSITTAFVSVIDHYLFKGFCYEARAFMLLEAVSFYCKRFSFLYGGNGRRPSEEGRREPFPFLMRCRTTNLPVVRLFQKLHRFFVPESTEDQVDDLRESNRALHDCGKRRQAPSVQLAEVAEGEVLHVHLSSELVNDIAMKLCDKVSTPRIRKLNRIVCVVQSERGVVPATPTPFDAIVERHRERWLIENELFRKQPFKSASSDGEDRPTGAGDETTKWSWSGSGTTASAGINPGQLKLEVAHLQVESHSATCSSGHRPSSGKPRGPLDSSSGTNDSLNAGDGTSPSAGPLGAERGPSLVETDRSWESSATSVERLVTTPASTTPSATPSRPASDQIKRGAPAFFEPAFLPAGSPVQVNNGNGLWLCGYWLEASRPLALHWFDPTLSENAILEHYGPLWVRDLVGGARLVTPNSTGKVYVAVGPFVQVFPSPRLEGGSVEVRALFERNHAVQ
jgi:hypothetical protein